MIKCPYCKKEFELAEQFKAELEKGFQEELAKAKQVSMEEARKEATEEFEKILAASRDSAKKERDTNVDLRVKLEEATLAKETAEAEAQKKIIAETEKVRRAAKENEETMRKEIREQMEGEKDHEITMLKKSIELRDEDIKKLKERGSGSHSQQAAGAAFEVQVEEKLVEAKHEAGVLDEVLRTKNKGDIKHTVIDGSNKECGIIIWEVKKTKSWGGDWIETLKRDMEDRGAVLGIIVVQDSMEKVENRWHEGDRIFVTKLGSVKTLALAFRKKIIEVHKLKNTQNFESKDLEVAYKYIFDGKFAENINHIITSFDRDEELLKKEKDAAKKSWGERETRIANGRDAALTLLGGIEEIKAIREGSKKILIAHSGGDNDAG